MTESHLPAAIPGSPRPLTEFIGRTTERTDLACLVRTQRLVTVTGPGGAGKTRLALVVAEEIEVRRHWVALASLPRGELVAPTVARAVGLSDAGPEAAVDELASAWGQDEVLLLLDTCEHVADSVADMVEDLLGRCPGLSVLVTSRTPLRVPGEYLWPIPPMGAVGSPAASDPYPSDAVELFVSRARAVRPELDTTPDSVATIAAICSRLDGNPLAIELCAARAQVLSLGQIHSALDDSLRLLVSHSRSAPQRQQTLRATLDWSHRLLLTEEAELFRRLSVFAGGATLEAVVAVADHQLTPVAALDLLSGLADRSLLRVGLDHGTARYELAEPVRQYAQQRLEESGEEAACRDRHLVWYLAEARAAAETSPGAGQSAAFARLERELPNLRSAYSWAQQRGDRRRALELATRLSSFANDHGHYREGRGWLDQALAGAGDSVPADVDPALWAAALKEAGVLAFLLCDYAAAVNRLESARAVFTELADERGAKATEQAISGVLREQGDYDGAIALVAAGLAFWRSIGDQEAAVRALVRLAFAELLRGDHRRADRLATETLASARRVDDTATVASALVILGGAALAAGDLGAATGHLEQAHAWAVDHQLAEAWAYAEQGLGLIALARGDVAAATTRLQSSLRRQHELGDHWRTSSVLVNLAACRRLRGDLVSAARLLGASEMLLEQIGGQLPPVEWAERDRTGAAVDARLSKDERDAAWMSGRSTPLASTIAAALAGWDDEPRAGAPTVAVRTEPSPARELALTLRGLGREEVQLDRRVLSRADFSYAKPRELLFFLAEVGPADKARIGLALWPDATPAELRSAFHTTLHHLRKAVGVDRILFEHGRYRLCSEHLEYDVAAFTRALADARRAPNRAEELNRLHRAVELYAGDFLPSSLPAWSERTREELRDRYHRALMAMGRIQLSRGAHAAAIDAFRRVVAGDPLSEAAHRELMRCYQAAGEPSRATRHYEKLAVLLREELGTVPDDSTVALYERIRTS